MKTNKKKTTKDVIILIVFLIIGISAIYYHRINGLY